MDKLKVTRVCLHDGMGRSRCGILTKESQKIICSLFETKPDESRLLSEEERAKYNCQSRKMSGITALREAPIKVYITDLLKAQRDLTASMVRGETLWDVIHLLQQKDDRYGEELVKAFKEGEMPE